MTIGLLSASFSLFQFISSPVLGELSDRFGRRPILLFSILGTVASFLLLGVAKTLPMLFLARIVDGISGGNISTAQAYIADITPKEKRSQSMGLIGAAFGLGFITGPALGGWLSSFGYSVPAYVAAAVAGVAAILAFFFLPETVNKAMRAKGVKKPLFSFKEMYTVSTSEAVGPLVIMAFLSNMSFSMMQGTFALFTEHRLFMGPGEVGALFALIGVLSVVVQMGLLKYVVAFLGEKWATAASILMSAAALMLMGWVFSIRELVVAIVLLSLGQGVLGPVITGRVSEKTPPDEQGNVMGVLQSVGSLARLIGPILGTAFFQPNCYGFPFVAAGIILLFCLPLVEKKYY